MPLLKSFIRSSLFILTIVLFSESTFAQQWTMEKKIALNEPSDPVISPDGKYVAYTIRKADLEENKWNTQIYLVSTEDKTIRQMTSSAFSCSNPAWSPDSKLISFVSGRPYLDASLDEQSGTTQLFVVPVGGGEAVHWSKLKNGVDEYVWSKDGSKIAMLSDEALDEQQEAAMLVRREKKINAVSTADPKPGKAIWILDVASRINNKLAAVDAGVANMDWSPDGSNLVYQTNYSGEYNDDQKFDIWTIDMEGKTRQLTKAEGPERNPQYSPDGKYISYLTQTVPDIEFAETDISIMNADGSEQRNLSKWFDYSVNQVLWTRDSKSVIILTAERTFNSTYLVKLAGGKWVPFTSDMLPMGNISMSEKGMLAFSFSGPNALREIKTVYNPEPGELAPEHNTLTSYTAQLTGLPLGEQSVITIKSSDGKFDIEALLIKPVDYEEGKRYPLLLAYHGGPYGRFTNKRMQYYATNILAEQGVMTVMPNVRGSSGGTDKFGQSNRYDLGGGDYRDGMDIVRYLIDKGMVDSTRMGVMGGSYGGYMTNWTISQTQRFAAAVSLYGIFSWFTDWSNSFQPSFEQMYFGYNYWDRPIDNNSLWISRAPQTYVKSITTPTLILHGTEDRYTNIANSREMYSALKELGVTTEFVTYRGAHHGLRTKPTQYIDAVNRTVAWLMKYLKQ
jgi:dipeptidyl aminopeptidase/acylaminoacyl peptidase